MVSLLLHVTVLEHSPESYQNTLKQAPSNVRASHSAMRGWSREFAETLRRYDGTSGSSAHQTVSTGPVPTEVDQTRTMSGFSSGKDGKVKSKGNCKSKDGKGKGKGKKGDKSKDSKPEQFQGYCLKSSSCSKSAAFSARSGDTRVTTAGNASPTASSKGGAAAASADNDGDVAAVMEVDDAVMGTEDDETSRGWCFDVSNQCAAVGSTGSLLLDSGSDEHLCAPKFADFIPDGSGPQPPQTQGCATE